FFSSRRRHTSFSRDWSSDVCSSDLLHGMWSDVEDDAGRFHMRKHTVSMPPGTRRTYRVTADALGRWAYHCHLLFHMEAGMFRERSEERRVGKEGCRRGASADVAEYW